MIKGSHLTEEQKQKIRNNAKTNPNYGMKGKKHSEQTKIIMKTNRTGKRTGSKNTFYGKHHSEETKEKISENKKKFFAENPAKAKEHSKRIKELYIKNPMQHIIASNAQKKRYENPKEREASRKINKEKWSKSEYIRKQMESRNVEQNKVEKLLGDYLEEWFPNEWRFVGDGEVIIGRRCPDFISSRNNTKLIELFGDYWHKGHNPQDRIDYFKQQGYDCLVIWEHELANLHLLKSAISKFLPEKINNGD